MICLAPHVPARVQATPTERQQMRSALAVLALYVQEAGQVGQEGS